MNNELITLSKTDLLALISELTVPMENRMREHLKDAFNEHLIPRLNSSLAAQQREVDRALEKVDNTCAASASVQEQLKTMHELIASFNEERGAIRETVDSVKSSVSKSRNAAKKTQMSTAFQVKVLDQQLGKLEKKMNSKVNRLIRRLTDLEMKVSAMTLQEFEDCDEEESPASRENAVISREGSVIKVDIQQWNK